ncbi:MAG: TlpA family protein disulfide reductase [Pirellulales bacterium]|nr:TlpA family protein disulfide reductase [Pirellulales bacterium]
MSASPALHLRVGDSIPCEVKKIDEKGVTFYSPVTDATFVAAEKVKAVELATEKQTRNIGKTKRDRLLTLPRMQRNNPPTHLVIAKNGDFLRGRLNELNDKSLSLEIRMERRELSRNKISRIIWLHPETKEAEGKEPLPPLGAGLVQTMRRDGARLTFQPDRCDDGIISGKSEVLGPCRVDVSLVDQILMGKAIDDAQVNLAYHPWHLHDAIEPKYVEEVAQEENPSSTAGMESPLIGKLAPDFNLPLVAGGSLRLSSLRGSVVVLDFFATWCGPCVQAMPTVEKTVEEFKAQNVKLVAVNMQEDAKKIGDLLERLNIKPTIAMDLDGAAAEKYGVTAIPQTVVIDAQGKIARIFIGGGQKLPDQLAEAIKAVLNLANTAN